MVVIYLALMTLETLAWINSITDMSHASLFYLFLSTAYPTSSKDLLPFFTNAISHSKFTSSAYWTEGVPSSWIRYAIVGLFSCIPRYNSTHAVSTTNSNILLVQNHLAYLFK